MDCLQAAVFDLGIDLGCSNTGMAEHFLQGTNLGSTCQHVRREAVPERVWADFVGGSNTPGIAFHDLPDINSSE